MSIHHHVAIYNATKGETRICPACRHKQLVPASRKGQAVPCEKCRKPVPPAAAR